VSSQTPEELASLLERHKVAGWIDTPAHDVVRKARMLADGDRSAQMGLGSLLPTTDKELAGALEKLSGWDERNGKSERAGSWVSPRGTVEQIESASGRLALACQRGERVLFGTGHPTGPLEMYAHLAAAMGERGAQVLRVLEGDSFEQYIGGSRIRYVCDVACVSLSGDLVHTHSSKPMEFMLANGLKIDLVVGDHGFCGAALAAGADAVAVVDTNDPALVLAWARGLPIWPILCDDNRPAASYQPVTQYILERL
jgi:hypothetical protein